MSKRYLDERDTKMPGLFNLVIAMNSHIISLALAKDSIAGKK